MRFIYPVYLKNLHHFNGRKTHEIFNNSIKIADREKKHASNEVQYVSDKRNCKQFMPFIYG